MNFQNYPSPKALKKLSSQKDSSSMDNEQVAQRQKQEYNLHPLQELTLAAEFHKEPECLNTFISYAKTTEVMKADDKGNIQGNKGQQKPRDMLQRTMEKHYHISDLSLNWQWRFHVVNFSDAQEKTQILSQIAIIY